MTATRKYWLDIKAPGPKGTIWISEIKKLIEEFDETPADYTIYLNFGPGCQPLARFVRDWVLNFAIKHRVEWGYHDLAAADAKEMYAVLSEIDRFYKDHKGVIKRIGAK